MAPTAEILVVVAQPERNRGSADDWLSERELALVEQLPGPDRKAEWRLGRWMAKHVVARRVAGDLGAQVALDQVEILADESGQPRARVRLAGVLRQVPLSLSHSGTWVAAACGAVDDELQIGIDIERIDPSLIELQGRFADPEEVEASRGTATAPQTATLLWSLKESAIKALGGRSARRKTYRVWFDRLGPTAVVRHQDDSLHGGYRIMGDRVATWLWGRQDSSAANEGGCR